mmetsp:Transcript_3957/g.4583  ORF Transcript_3957/g.4583 Transcript_3957/m.4583 type:complete len:158 (+) Transcript_3957:28-501(+)|eukprot:CAMPEP_0205822268 /NCGR_PEP_ID=MMETSP0206-20130828/11854_1 /ASSEMBLY_ACC=CAM_ASM_000279 /TAXON_ID=36767 /ORGANISM="Euplotes focardii, Strain TN1" /LENGTH=157 /DNA_ID=CAMNT_0053118401 /DNA_START=22 /DNA_END=495 /DNA_ORIENTATION=+
MLRLVRLAPRHLRVQAPPLGSQRFFATEALTVTTGDAVAANMLGEQKYGLTSGMPLKYTVQKVRIFQPCKDATQHARNSNKWKLTWGTKRKWKNPLMGWTSTSDTIQSTNTTLNFDCKEDAIGYAKQQGFPYEVKEPEVPTRKVKAYSDNYKWRGNP